MHIEPRQALAALKGRSHKPGKQVRLHRAAVRYRFRAVDPAALKWD